jgi:hypothetical protein
MPGAVTSCIEKEAFNNDPLSKGIAAKAEAAFIILRLFISVS